MAQRKRNESGQSIVIMAFAIIVLMGIMAVAIDGGRIFTLRRDAQNAADAAALQGARSLCRDEDYEAIALEVAERGGFAGANVVEVNNPPVRSDSATINEDQVEVVITATIDGGLIAPIIYDGKLTTRVLAVGDCLRGELSGSGSAIFAYAPSCPGKEVDMSGSSITVIGGVHSNGDVQISGGGGGNYITGTISYGGDVSVNTTNTTVVPADGNPVQVTDRNYPFIIDYDDFRPGGWAYTATITANPTHYHYFPPNSPANKPRSRADFVDFGWITGNQINEGVYVSPDGFKFSGVGGSNGLVADKVTFVSLGTIDFSSNQTYMRPYFQGLMIFTEATGNVCDSNPAVKMSGSTVNWGGIIFAPYGLVNMSFSDNSTFFGSIIAGTVNVGGSNTMIIYDPSYLPPDPDTIELGT